MRRLLAIVLLGGMVAGCSGSDEGAGASPAPATSAPASPAPIPPSPAAPATPPAPSAPAPPPSGAADSCQDGEELETFPDEFQGPLQGDLDGDGSPDEVYVDGVGPGDTLPRVAVRTAAGTVHSLEVSARRPWEVAVRGVADADGDGAAEVFVDRSVAGPDGAGSSAVVSLVVFADCELAFVTNEEGQPYDFLVSEGRGLGCVDADGDGEQDLVGLETVARPDGGHDYTRTIVELDGTTASNGAVDSGASDQPPPPSVSCGDDPFTTPLAATPDQ